MIARPLPFGTMIWDGNEYYTIREVLGIGGLGITYRASCYYTIGNILQEGQVAIKELFTNSCYRDYDGVRVVGFSSPTDFEKVKKEFIEETWTISNLCMHSRSLVNINQPFEENGTAYCVMEYLDGGNLKAESKEEALKYILQLSNAIKVLHDHRILHLDIKPSNILLKEDRETHEYYPVLVDFGIAKYFDSEGRSMASPEARGASIGYAPLEQYGDIKSFVPGIDIYAMGATLYALLTGKNPPSASRLLRNLTVVEDELRRCGCKEFYPFISKAMAIDYRDRHKDVDEFARELRRIVPTDEELKRDSLLDDVTTTTIIGEERRTRRQGKEREKWGRQYDDEPAEQKYYPNEEATMQIIKQQLFKIDNKIIRINIQQIPWGHYGITDNEGRVIAPFIYDSISPFSELCSIPGPGLPEFFLGAKYTIGDEIGFFKITEKGILIDYARFDLQTYEHRCQLT